MTHQEGFFQNADQQQIFYQCWLPAQAPRAVVMISHGLGEHSGRYGNVVEHLLPLGYAVYALDHAGHGRSQGHRACVASFSEFTDTLKQFFDQIRDWQPGLPVILLGHSMGGLIAASYLLEHQAGLSAAVLSAPAVKAPDNVSALTVAVGKLLSRYLPKAGILALDASGISRDPAVVQAYLDDPLVYTGKVSARLAAEMLQAMQRLQQQAHTITLPLLLLQGTDDSLVDPAGAPELFLAVGSDDKSLKQYSGFYHELFNEPEAERQRVLDDMAQWLADVPELSQLQERLI